MKSVIYYFLLWRNNYHDHQHLFSNQFQIMLVPDCIPTHIFFLLSHKVSRKNFSRVLEHKGSIMMVVLIFSIILWYFNWVELSISPIVFSSYRNQTWKKDFIYSIHIWQKFNLSLYILFNNKKYTVIQVPSLRLIQRSMILCSEKNIAAIISNVNNSNIWNDSIQCPHSHNA